MSHSNEYGVAAQDTMAEFATGLSLSDIPTHVIEHAKLDILDTIGCAIFGQTQPIAGILDDGLSWLGHEGPYPIWGSNKTTDMETAALINGTLTHSFELDDLHPLGILHPGGTCLPAVLALAQRQGSSGKDVVTSHIVGLEIACRVGLACGQGLLIRGWHNNGILGIFGGATGSAKMLGLSAKQTAHAMGTAGSLAGGLMAAQFGSMVKRLHAGQAAQGGLRAAVLAARDFTGIENLFEIEYGGFLATFVDKSTPEDLIAGLGTDWETLRVGFKMYPACGSSHTSISIIQEMKKDRDFGPDDIDSILVKCSKATHEHVGWRYEPNSVTTAQMNLPYAVATTIANGTVGVDDYDEATIFDPARVGLAQLVTTVPEQDIIDGGRERRHEVWMTVNLKDGSVLEGRETNAPGSPLRPATADQVAAKFANLATRVVGEKRVDGICEFVLSLEKQDDLAPLFELLK